MLKKGAKVWCFIVILTVVGLMFSGLIATTSATTEKTTVSVTDSSPWFTKGTNSGIGPWYPHPYEDPDYISTYVGGMSWLGGSPSEPDCWARFKPYLSQPGEYEVYAYFYAGKYTSTNVPFTVRYDGGTKTIKVDQYSSIPTWKEEYLGTWNFEAGQDTYVEVTDATGEPFDNIKGLTIGAIKFVKKETVPTPTLTPPNVHDIAVEHSEIPVLNWPLKGEIEDRRILLGFGDIWTWTYCGGLPKKHTGVDLKANVGEDVYAAYDGVAKAPYTLSSKHNWGKGVVIEHSGFTTTYMHVNPVVNVGVHVNKGQKIAIIGSIDGYEHLHFGVRNSAYSDVSKRGALPQKHGDSDYDKEDHFTGCKNDPLFPEKFIDPMKLKYGLEKSETAPKVAKPVLTYPLKITPEKDKYYVGDILSAQFILLRICFL